MPTAEGRPAERLRIGLACTGWAAEWAVHDPIRNGSLAEVVFAASRAPAFAADYADSHVIPQSGSWGSLLACEEVECVYVAVPNSAHALFVEEALLAGKHVLCEKPLTRSGDIAARLAELAASQGLVLAEGMHHRYYPPLQAAVRALRSGVVGRLRRIEVDYGWLLDRGQDIRWASGLDGGALMDVGCYGLDILHWIAGGPLRVIESSCKRSPSGVDSSSSVELAGVGLTGVVRASLASAELVCRAEVVGSGGRAVLERPCLPVLPTEHRRMDFSMSVNGMELPLGTDSKTSYHYQLDAFIRAVRVGEVSDPGGLELVARARLLDQACNSLRGKNEQPV
nr:Gfo/Idh/MocA family oxidoreductase [Streptomyces sp. 846.5]